MGIERKRLSQLFFPIFFEILFSMLTGVADTLMLSSQGDQAVGAVSTANTYMNVFIVLFAIVSSGMVAVMTQYIGARRPGVAHQALRLGLVFNLIVGLVISATLHFGAESILIITGTADQLLEPAATYLKTVSLFCLCNALTPIFSSYLRAFGHTAPTLSGTVVANVVNVGLNACFLFVMDWGIYGVALATGISRLVNLIWVWAVSYHRIRPIREANPPENREIFEKIIHVGLPAAMETTLYNLAMTIVISMLNWMDETGMQATVRAYTVQIANFHLAIGAALAQANANMVGWHIGAKDFGECNRDTRKAAILGVCLGVGTAIVFALLSHPILRLFTDDPDIIHLVSILLIIDVVLEIGRMINLIFGMALKTSGDATYPMIVAVAVAFLCAAGGTWYFGIYMGWLAVGAYVAMALDECVRALFMFLRWQKGYWKKENLLCRM